MFWTYILYSTSLDRFYVGQTANLVRRLQKHNSHHKGFTGQVNDWTIVYYESFETKREAILRENEIKKWKSRTRIELLIQKYE